MWERIKIQLRTLLKRLRAIGIGADRAVFFENLELLMRAGVPLAEALETIAAGARGWRMRAILREIGDAVTGGSTFHSALNDTGAFSDEAVAFIKSGEAAGELPDHLAFLVAQKRRASEFRSRITSAALYPIVVFGIALVVAVGVAWFILPRLATVFAQLNADLPTITRWLIAAGEFLDERGTVVVPSVLGGLIVLVVVLASLTWTRRALQWSALALPGFGELLREVELARMGHTIGSLLSAGVPIAKALDVLASGTNLWQYRQLYRAIHEDVCDGIPLAEALERQDPASKRIPSEVQRIINAAEQSGELPHAFSTIGDQLAQRTETTAKNIGSLIEPALLFLVWLAVVGIAIAVILPIYDLTGGLRDSV